MIAILDMKKPRSCIKCDVHIAHDYCDHFSQFGVGAKTDGVYPDCPLIEIVRCGECKFMSEHYDTDGNAPYWTCSEWDSGTDIDGYCYLGERRMI